MCVKDNLKRKKMRKAPCPFCTSKHNKTKGEGCCNCCHTGFVPVGELCHFRTQEEALNHDPEISYEHLKYNRSQGLPDNHKLF